MKANLDTAHARFVERQGLLVPRALGSAHEAASLTDKALARWQPLLGSPDAELLPEKDTLTARGRDLLRNNGLAKGALNTLADNVVGRGFRLQAIPDHRALGIEQAQAEEMGAQLEAAWKDWATTSACDASGRRNLAKLTQLVFKAAYGSGAALCLPRWKPKRPGTRWATCLRLVEIDRLGNPQGRMDTSRLRGGVEIDPDGAPVAYHIQASHPGDAFLGLGQSLGGQWVRVPAATAWGRRRVIHFYDDDRPEQTHGKPWITEVMPQFKALDHFERVELQAAIVGAMIAAFVETPLPQEEAERLFSNWDTPEEAAAYAQRGVRPIRPGMMAVLPPGTTVKPFMPNRPANAFAPYVEAALGMVAPGLHLSPEMLLKDFRRSNYASQRAMLLELWRTFLVLRDWLVFGWCQAVYELLVEEAVGQGVIAAPDFYERKAAYCQARWIGGGRGWVDPVKEAQGARLRIAGGFSTLQQECNEQGLDWEEVLDQRFRERARVKQKEAEYGFDLGGADSASWLTGNGAPEDQTGGQP